METQSSRQDPARLRPRMGPAIGLVLLGVALAVAGIYVGETDDAPGAALLGLLLMVGLVALGVRIARRKT